MDFSKHATLKGLPPLKSHLKDVSALEDFGREILLGPLPENLKNFNSLEELARQLQNNSQNVTTGCLTHSVTKQVASEQILHHQQSEEKRAGFLFNQECNKKSYETSFFTNQQEQQKQFEFLKNSQNKKYSFEHYFKNEEKSSAKKSSKKKFYTCSNIVGGAKDNQKRLNSNPLYKDSRCAEIMCRYEKAKKPYESFTTLAKELSKAVGFNITRYQAAYQYNLYLSSVDKSILKPSTKTVKKAETSPSAFAKKIQSKLSFMKKQKSPLSSPLIQLQSKLSFKKKQKSPSSPVSVADAMKKLEALQKQSEMIAQQQQQITKQQNGIFKFLLRKLGKDVEDEEVMQPKSEGFDDAMSLTSEKQKDGDLSMTSAKLDDDAMSVVSENSKDSASSFKSTKSHVFEDGQSQKSSISENYEDAFSDAFSFFSSQKDAESVLSDSSSTISMDKKNDKKVTFENSDCKSESKSELDITDESNSSFGSESNNVVEKNKKGQVLTDYYIKKNSKLKPMLVINQGDDWYSYTVKNKGIKSQQYECSLCPRHSQFKSKGTMKDGKFWVHPRHSPLCKPMTKEELEVLQINRDVREDVSKGYNIQDSYWVGYKKAQKQGIEKEFPMIEDVCKSLDRWKAKTFPPSEKGKIAEEHKVLLNGDKFLIFEDKQVAVFMSDECARTMAECRILVADPTFKTSPQGFMQTLYIHGLVETKNGSEWRPLLMAPINSKKEEDYLKIVKAINDRWLELGVEPKFERFHTDYETALFNAFAKLDGVDKMFGCIFHYDKAVLKSVKDAGLFSYYHVKKGKKIPEYKAIKRWVRTLMALPMLPKEDIPILAEELLKIPQPPAGSKVDWPTKELEKVKTYIQTEWLDVFKEDNNNKWCFYQLGRTKNTNAAEGYHSGLSKTLPKKPKYKVFLELQKNRFTMNDTRIYQLKNKTVKTKCISKKYKEVAERIEKYEARLEKLKKKKNHTPESYLYILRKHCERVSHSLHEVRNKSLQTLKSKKKVSKSYNKVVETEDIDSLFSDISNEEESEESEESEDEKDQMQMNKKEDSSMKNNPKADKHKTKTKSAAKGKNKVDEAEKKSKVVKEEKEEAECKSSLKSQKSFEKLKLGKQFNSTVKKMLNNFKSSKDGKQEAREDTKTEEDNGKRPRGRPKKNQDQKSEEKRAFEVPPFIPPSLKELQAACKSLEIPEKYAESSPLLKAKRGTIVFSNLKTHNVRGDGNCGFRSLSYLLTGSQEFHWQIRMKVMEYVVNNREKVFMTDERYTAYVSSYETVAGYQKPRGVTNTHWASDNDFLGFAKMTNINVYIHNPPDKKYNYSRCIPLVKDGKWNKQDSGFFIDWVGERHFVPIIDV